MSIQSSINQMLSSIANQQLFKGLTTKVGEIKTDTENITNEQKGLTTKVGDIRKDTENITNEQKRFNELIQKHGSIQAVEDAADVGKDFGDIADDVLWSVNKLHNIAQTRKKLAYILAEDTQDAVKERYEQAKGGAQK